MCQLCMINPKAYRTWMSVTRCQILASTNSEEVVSVKGYKLTIEQVDCLPSIWEVFISLDPFGMLSSIEHLISTVDSTSKTIKILWRPRNDFGLQFSKSSSWELHSYPFEILIAKQDTGSWRPEWHHCCVYYFSWVDQETGFVVPSNFV